MGALGVLLFAIGAILAFALNVAIPELDLEAVGLIMMGVGLVAFIGAVLRDGPFQRTRHERHVSADGHHVLDETNTGF